MLVGITLSRHGNCEAASAGSFVFLGAKLVIKREPNRIQVKNLYEIFTRINT